MPMKNLSFGLAFVLLTFCGTGAALSDTSQGPHLLAYSKQQGIHVYAIPSENQSWCGADLTLTFEPEADENPSFPYESTNNLMRKLGKVIAIVCPRAQTATVSGLSTMGDVDAEYFTAKASKDDGWRLNSIDGMKEAPEEVTLAGPLSAQGPRYTDLNSGERWYADASPSASTTVSKPSEVAAAKADFLSELDKIQNGSATSPSGARTPSSSPSSGSAAGSSPDNLARAPEVIRTAKGPSVHLADAVALNGWVPRKAGAPIETPEGIYEFDIPVNAGAGEGACKLRYDRVQNYTLAQSLSAQASGYECRNGYLNGTGRVAVYNANGSVNSVLDGAFTEGYSSGARVWDMPVLARGKIPPPGKNRGLERNIVVLLSRVDKERHIDFGLAMQGIRSRWDLCRTPIALLLTDNAQLFRDDDSARPLLIEGAAELHSACPDATEVEVYAVTTPYWSNFETTNPEFLAFIDLNYGSDGKWVVDGERYFNAEKERVLMAERDRMARLEAEFSRRNNEWQKAKAKLGWLQTASPRERLAYYFRTNDFANPRLSIAQAKLYGSAPTAAYVLNVDEVKDGSATASWPVDLRIIEPIDTAQPILSKSGWYLVYGQMQTSGDKDGPEGILTLSQGQRCGEDECAEIKDALTLVRDVENQPDFDPDKPPSREQVKLDLESADAAAKSEAAGASTQSATAVSTSTSQR